MLVWPLLLFSFFAFAATSDIECPYVNSSLAGDRRVDKHTLRLVQYNVEWLFIDYCSSSQCPGSGCTWRNQSEAMIHLDYVTNVVKQLNPDIINFCEVEGCDELNLLQQKLNDTTYRSYLKKGTDTSTGQNVGMLTRIDPVVHLYRTEFKYNYPVSGSNCGYSGSGGSSGVSKHYITEFNWNGYDIALIAAHLLAMPTDPLRCSEREAQASVLQTVIASYVNDGYEVIVLGDLNDYDGGTLDVNQNRPTSRVLEIIKGTQGELAGAYQLYNVAEEIVQKERYSDWRDSDQNCNTSSIADFSMIDHILVTQDVQKNIANVFMFHGYDEYCGKYNSDHFPVVVDFFL